MKRCVKCKVDVNTERKTCPLCFTPLDNSNSDKSYEPYKHYAYVHRMKLSTKIFLFLSIVTIIAVFLINYYTKDNADHYWSLIIVFSIIYVWGLIKNLVLGKKNIVSRLTFNLYNLSTLLFIIDYFGSKKPIYWSLNYVIPFSIIVTMITSIIIVIVKKNLFVDSIISLIMLILIGSIFRILYYQLNIITVNWTSIMTLCASCLIALGMIVFQFRNIKNEIKKRFYF